MRDSIRLGRIAGVPVGLNWSLLVFAGLFSYLLAEGRLPEAVPGYSAAAYWAAGLLGAVAFLSSVLAHELGHATVAKRHGVPVAGITLWLLGGVAKLEKDAPDARSELRIAAAGPLVSLALAAGFGGLAVASWVLAVDDLATVVLGWLGTVNLVLALFNLLPAAPLDGGRILAAAVWRRTGDRAKGSRAASTGGRIVGFGLVALGSYEVLFAGSYFGIWTVMVGWFVLAVAAAEGRSGTARASLEGLRVRQVMRPGVPVADDWMSVDHFLASLDPRTAPPAIPVRRFDGWTVGVVRLERLVAIPSEQRAHTYLGAVLDNRIILAYPDEEILTVLDRLQPTQREIVVITPDGQAVGIVGPQEIERASRLGALYAQQQGRTNGPDPLSGRLRGS